MENEEWKMENARCPARAIRVKNCLLLAANGSDSRAWEAVLCLRLVAVVEHQTHNSVWADILHFALSILHFPFSIYCLPKL